MILDAYVKGPGETGDYDIDYTPWLRQGETITGATATVECTSTPADTALTVVDVTASSSAIRVRLAAGTAGETYSVTVTANSSSGRVEVSSFVLRVELPHPQLTYNDSYLAPLVTPEREARALAEVDDIYPFSAAWRARLAVIRAYIIAATESQRTPDDLFDAKIKRYTDEWRTSLPLARAAADAESGSTGAGSLISISMERA